MHMHKIRKILCDNRADMNMERMITIVIAFVCGALLVAAIWSALSTYFPSGIDTNIHDYLG